MRVLLLFAHPVDASFAGALHQASLRVLRAGGHAVDDLDLYAEGFDPVMSEAERRAYHDPARNRAGVEPYVARLLAAEGLVIVAPVWNFFYPAILKGFLDRVFLPGVSFELTPSGLRPILHNITRLVVVATYGATPLRAFLAGDPPRKMATRVLRATIAPGAKVDYLALYDMNRIPHERRTRFLGEVERTMARF